MADSLSVSCRQPRAQQRSTLAERWRDGRNRMRRRDGERDDVSAPPSLCPPQDIPCLLSRPSSSSSSAPLLVISGRLPITLPLPILLLLPPPHYLSFDPTAKATSHPSSLFLSDLLVLSHDCQKFFFLLLHLYFHIFTVPF